MLIIFVSMDRPTPPALMATKKPPAKLAWSVSWLAALLSQSKREDETASHLFRSCLHSNTVEHSFYSYVVNLLMCWFISCIYAYDYLYIRHFEYIVIIIIIKV